MKSVFLSEDFLYMDNSDLIIQGRYRVENIFKFCETVTDKVHTILDVLIKYKVYSNYRESIKELRFVCNFIHSIIEEEYTKEHYELYIEIKEYIEGKMRNSESIK